MSALHARQRRLLEDLLGTARRELDTVNRALSVGDGHALRLARETAEAAVLGYADALAEHMREHPDEAELTPVMGTSKSQQLRAATVGLADRTARILDEANDGPARHEP